MQSSGCNAIANVPYPLHMDSRERLQYSSIGHSPSFGTSTAKGTQGARKMTITTEGGYSLLWALYQYFGSLCSPSPATTTGFITTMVATTQNPYHTRPTARTCRTENESNDCRRSSHHTGLRSFRSYQAMDILDRKADVPGACPEAGAGSSPAWQVNLLFPTKSPLNCPP